MKRLTLIAIFLFTLVPALHAQDTREGVISFGIRPDGFDRAQDPTDEPVAFQKPLDVRYPDEAIRRKLEGITIVAAEVDDAGAVSYAEVRTGSGHAVLDSAAIAAVVQGYYRPARRDGRTVTARITIPVEFRLDGNPERAQGDKSAEQLQQEKRELENAKRMLEEEQRKLQEELDRLKAQQKENPKQK